MVIISYIYEVIPGTGRQRFLQTLFLVRAFIDVVDDAVSELTH